MNIFIQSLIQDDPYKIVLSNKSSKDNEFNKIVITKKNIKGSIMYQLEKFTNTQAFHKNITINELENTLIDYMTNSYKQLNAFSIYREYSMKVSKKGKVLTNIKTTKNIDSKSLEKISSHNKEKEYLLKEGTIIPPLIDLGIFSKEGKIINSKYDKYKQINKFIEIVEDSLKDYHSDTIRIIDFGCGKSYLTFIMYYYLVEIKHMNVHITGLDLKEKVIETYCTNRIDFNKSLYKKEIINIEKFENYKRNKNKIMG